MILAPGPGGGLLPPGGSPGGPRPPGGPPPASSTSGCASSEANNNGGVARSGASRVPVISVEELQKRVAAQQQDFARYESGLKAALADRDVELSRLRALIHRAAKEGPPASTRGGEHGGSRPCSNGWSSSPGAIAGGDGGDAEAAGGGGEDDVGGPHVQQSSCAVEPPRASSGAALSKPSPNRIPSCDPTDDRSTTRSSTMRSRAAGAGPHFPPPTSQEPEADSAEYRRQELERWYNTTRTRHEEDLTAALRSNAWLVESLKQQANKIAALTAEHQTQLEHLQKNSAEEEKALRAESERKCQLFAAQVAELTEDFGETQRKWEDRCEGVRRAAETEVEVVRGELREADAVVAARGREVGSRRAVGQFLFMVFSRKMVEITGCLLQGHSIYVQSVNCCERCVISSRRNFIPTFFKNGGDLGDLDYRRHCGQSTSARLVCACRNRILMFAISPWPFTAGPSVRKIAKISLLEPLLVAPFSTSSGSSSDGWYCPHGWMPKRQPKSWETIFAMAVQYGIKRPQNCKNRLHEWMPKRQCWRICSSFVEIWSWRILLVCRQRSCAVLKPKSLEKFFVACPRACRTSSAACHTQPASPFSPNCLLSPRIVGGLLGGLLSLSSCWPAGGPGLHVVRDHRWKSWSRVRPPHSEPTRSARRPCGNVSGRGGRNSPRCPPGSPCRVQLRLTAPSHDFFVRLLRDV